MEEESSFENQDIILPIVLLNTLEGAASVETKTQSRILPVARELQSIRVKQMCYSVEGVRLGSLTSQYFV
jgi:hypothetical protein